MLKLPANTDLQMTWYNTSHALWMAGFSIQQLLVTWILVGILDQSPETVGLAQLTKTSRTASASTSQAPA